MFEDSDALWLNSLNRYLLTADFVSNRFGHYLSYNHLVVFQRDLLQSWLVYRISGNSL